MSYHLLTNEYLEIIIFDQLKKNISMYTKKFDLIFLNLYYMMVLKRTVFNKLYIFVKLRFTYICT